ncbi:MAG TPA: universal stress protein [bacterium]|nr:universal stress protein [bacterium]
MSGGIESMYRRVLIPVDGSDCSQAALEHGLGLAHEQQAEVRLIHVVDTRSLYTFENMNVEPVETAWRQAGQEILDRAEAHARRVGVAAVTVSLIETVGRGVAGVIVAECEHWPADLIVMGTHGRHGIERALLGSVAEGVVRASPVPVLLIRRH